MLKYGAWGLGWCLVIAVLWVLLPVAAYGMVAVLWQYHLVATVTVSCVKTA